MKKTIAVLLGFLLLGILLAGCIQEPQKPEGAVNVVELITNPVYNTPIEVYGEIGGLGLADPRPTCPCLFLKYGKVSITVWYDLMIKEDGTAMPAVNIDKIKNNDWVLVTGEFQPESFDLWAISIEVIK